MATTKAKKTTKKVTKSAPAKSVKRGMTVKECMAESQILKLHMTVITILSCVVCALVVALVLALKD